MSALKTQPTAQTLTAFIAGQPEGRREECRVLDALMRQATGEEAVLWGSIVGYGRYAYTRSDGKTYEWPVTGFSPRKQALTVYVTPGFEGDEAQLARLGKHTTSKSCLYIKRLSDIDVAVLGQIIEEGVTAMAPQRIR